MFCVSFRLPFEVEKVEKPVLAEKGGMRMINVLRIRVMGRENEKVK